MHISAYRFVAPIVVVIRDLSGYKLRQLPAGSIFLPTGSQPDRNGMVDGTCQSQVVLVFVRDLNERAEPVYDENGLELALVSRQPSASG